jgi:hypothetical protein
VFLLVAHFQSDTPASGPIPEEVKEPLALLAASPECRRLHFARSTDAADRFVLVAEFETAAAYRRSLSPWPMRIAVVPWLSTADVQYSAVNEVLYSSMEDVVVVSEPTVPDPGR